MLGIGIVVAAKLLWDLFNKKPEAGPAPEWAQSVDVDLPTGVAHRIRVDATYELKGSYTEDGTGNVVPVQIGPLTNSAEYQYAGKVRLLRTQGATVSGASPPTWGLNDMNATIEIYDFRGWLGTGVRIWSGGVSVGNGAGTLSLSYKIRIHDLTTGQEMFAGPASAGTWPDPSPQPLVPLPLPATAPEPFRLPAPAPVPTILPATVPGSTPAPAPAPAPGGLPATAPATAPAPTTVPTVTTAITRATPGSQPQTLTATGVTTAPAPAPITQTPAQAVLIGTALIGGPGAAPPPGPAGTAAELGRIEKKMELTLDRVSPLAGLADALALLGELLNLLEEPSPGGSYSIRPACGTDAQGNPLPVIEVPIAGGLGVVGAIVPRLDAIAELLDLHKQLRQPVCKGKPTGNPVTVTGVGIG